MHLEFNCYPECDLAELTQALEAHGAAVTATPACGEPGTVRLYVYLPADEYAEHQCRELAARWQHARDLVEAEPRER